MVKNTVPLVKTGVQDPDCGPLDPSTHTFNAQDKLGLAQSESVQSRVTEV